MTNEWAKRDIAKAVNPPWVDKLIDDAVDEPSQTAMRDAADALAAAYVGSADHAIKSIDVDDPNALLLRSNTEAVDYAASRGAEMVGRRYDEDGRLVDNPNADWAISATTRDVLAREIRDAVALHWDVDKLADRLVDTGVFSDYRAEMIARTEVSMAQNQGVLEAGRQAQAAGMAVQKVWTLGDNPCPLCEEAAAEGAIDLDEDFGGDAGDAPPLHPNCECSLDLFVSDEDQQADEDDAQAALDEEDEVEDYEPGLKTPDDAANSEPRNAVIADWSAKSSFDTLGRIIDAAPSDQRLMERVGNVVADRIGADLKTAGHKVKTQKGIDRVIEKATKKYKDSGQFRRVSDVVRMTFVVDKPEQSDAAIKELSKYFEVAAEPWKPTDVLYTDRALNVRLPDGMVGEVQVMDYRMAEAKKQGGGHEQFKIMQDAAKAGPHPNKDRWLAAYDKSREIYQKVIDGYDADWKAAIGPLPRYDPTWKALLGRGGSAPNRE